MLTRVIKWLIKLEKWICKLITYYMNKFEGYLINDSYLIAGSKIADAINY
jgi:hypothetical protein